MHVADAPRFVQDPAPGGVLGPILGAFRRGGDPAATAYAGRLLVRLSVTPVRRTRLLSLPLDAMSDEPGTVPYVLKFQLYAAAGLAGTGQVAVDVDFGGARLSSPSVVAGADAVTFDCDFRPLTSVQPRDPAQAPDVIVRATRTVGLVRAQVAHLRLRLVDLLPPGADWAVNADAADGGGDDDACWAPRWRTLTPAGALLFTVGVGPAGHAPYERACLRRGLVRARPRPYVLRARIASAADLPAATDASLSNAFVVVRLAGASAATTTRYETLYPVRVRVCVRPRPRP